MRIIEYSNIGRRAQNQDFVLSKEIGENKAIYIVADGMGGYSDGDIAAKIAAEEIANHIAKGKTIPESVLDANAELSKTIRERGVSKMGCCFAGIEVDGDPRSHNDCRNGETWQSHLFSKRKIRTYSVSRIYGLSQRYS